MVTWIALFRGINVGGKNILPMKELTRELEKLGYTKIESYIQSGNAGPAYRRSDSEEPWHPISRHRPERQAARGRGGVQPLS
jgi:hypothetical protein